MPQDRDYLSLDFETRSHVSLPKVGAYRYAAHPSTEVICMSWAAGWDMEPVTWIPGRPIDPLFTEWTGPYRAWNATFERLIWHHVLRPQIALGLPALDRWYDTAAEAAALSLPRALAKAADVLQVPIQKDMEGRKLMLKYSRPRKRKGRPLEWWDDPADLQKIYRYCETDVGAEREVARIMPHLVERDLWLLDQRINDRGIRLDMPLVMAAQEAVEQETEIANKRIAVITKDDNASITKVEALKTWIRTHEPTLPDLTKDTVRNLLAGTDINKAVREVLQLRQDVGRTSLAKWFKVADVVGYNHRARGLLRYHAASTGRWGGVLLQPQNFPRPTVPDVVSLIPALLAGESPGMEALVSLLRSMVIPADGFRFMSGDYSQIELRALAWLSGGTYLDHPYHRMAGQIYDVPWESIEKDTVEYGIGKNAELGCGYGMGWKKYIDYVYTATGTRPPEALAQKAVGTYRDTHESVMSYHKKVEDAALAAVRNPGQPQSVGLVRYCTQGQFLWCLLPSGRGLAYALPKITMQKTPWGAIRPALVYQGVDTRTGRRVWGDIQTYGGHLVENIVQAVARDVMSEAMLRLEPAGYPIVLTVHDEILTEVPEGQGSLEEFEQLMTVRPEWGKTAPIEAECWEGSRWRK